MQPSPDRMQYSTEIKTFKYYTFTEGTCASQGDKTPGCTHGTATKVKDCTRKPDEPNKGTFVCDQNIQNSWEYFPQTDKWYFAYFEEYKKTIGRVTLLGKDCDCGVHKGRASLGAKLASWMMWTAPLGEEAVKSLANGHLPSWKPVVAYIGDFAHDQNYNGGAGGSRWPRAPELGAAATIEESPPSETFAKGALHYEQGLPLIPCRRGDCHRKGWKWRFVAGWAANTASEAFISTLAFYFAPLSVLAPITGVGILVSALLAGTGYVPCFGFPPGFKEHISCSNP